MDQIFFLDDELKARLLQRLRAGWVILFGNLDAISEIEQSLYTPGTPAAVLFEVYVSPFLPDAGFALVKKTTELHKKLNGVPDFDRTLLLFFGSRKKGEQHDYCNVIQRYSCDDNPSDEHLRLFIEGLFQTTDITHNNRGEFSTVTTADRITVTAGKKQGGLNSG